MKRVLVIGIGSLIMTDDAIGSRIAQAIRGRLQAHRIACFAGETDDACCFDKIRPGDFLVIVDAVSPGDEPGRIDVMPLRDALMNRGGLRAQHEFSLLDLIALHYPAMYGSFIGVEAAEIGLGIQLSEPLQKRFGEICDTVANIILSMKQQAEHV